MNFKQCAAVAAVGLLVSASAAIASPLAYAAFFKGDFGIIDLSSGAVSVCGNSGTSLNGLATDPSGSGTIFALASVGSTYELVTVNTPSGTLSNIGSTGLTGSLEGFGSTTTGVYAFFATGNVYQIDTTSASATLVGKLGFKPSKSNFQASNANDNLYIASGKTLYQVNTTNGTGTMIGPESAVIGALTYVNATMYGGTDRGSNKLYTVNLTNGADIFVSKVKGEKQQFFGLASIPAGGAQTCGG